MGRVVTTTLLVVALAAGIGHAGEVKFGLTADNTKVTFIGTKPGAKHEGGFKTLTGSATYDGKDATTLQFTVDIDMNSIYTDTDKLTNHLKSADFFDVKNRPKSQFVSSKVEKSGDGYKVSGKLTMNGKTKELSFPAKIEASGDKLNVTSSFKINRNDWNISYGKGVIADDISLSVKLTASK